MLRAYGDGNLFGETYGEGPVRVVWLHGWARRGQDFSAAASELALAGISSVALDLPGFGASPVPLVAGGARTYAELVAPVLREISEQPLVLVGHSLGGRIAPVVAANYPEVVKSLVLCGAPLVGQTHVAPPWSYRALRWMHGHSLVGDRRMEAARQRFGSSDYRNATGSLRRVLVAMVNESYEDELVRVMVPVSLLWGARDEVVPLDVAQRAMALIAGAHSLRVVEGVGHLLPTEAPHELVVSVREALA